jgi:hypothetical protein
MTQQTSSDFEHEKWRDEYKLRSREIDIKERAAIRDQWSAPLVLAILTAAVAGFGNAAAIWLNGVEQRKLETTKAEQARSIEETKAEAARILEMIRTGNPDKAAANLEFLANAGLIADPGRKASIQTFIEKRQPGKGPSLPIPIPLRPYIPPMKWDEPQPSSAGVKPQPRIRDEEDEPPPLSTRP